MQILPANDSTPTPSGSTEHLPEGANCAGCFFARSLNLQHAENRGKVFCVRGDVRVHYNGLCDEWKQGWTIIERGKLKNSMSPPNDGFAVPLGTRTDWRSSVARAASAFALDTSLPQIREVPHDETPSELEIPF